MKKFLHYIVLLVMSVLGCGSDNIEGSAEGDVFQSLERGDEFGQVWLS